MLRFVFALAACRALLAPGAANAQAYPSRQISIVVTFPPGGNADVTARLLADKLSQAFKQTVIVENKPGAATIPGTGAVLQAPADGYTLLQSGTNTNINPLLGNKTPYDAERDLVPVALLMTVPAILVVNADVPANNVAELIALAKSKPGELNYGSAGNGTFAHLAMAQLTQATGTNMTHVPFKGLAPAMMGLLRNDVQIMASDIPGALEHIRAGKLRALAHTGTDAHAAAAGPADARRGRREGLRGSRLPRHHGARRHAARGDRGAESRDQCSAQVAGDEQALRQQRARRRRRHARRPSRHLKRDRAIWSRVIAAGGIKAE